MPGEEKTVTVRFLMCQVIEKYLNVGRKWWIQEGPQFLEKRKLYQSDKMCSTAGKL